MLSHSMARDALIYTGVNGSGGAGSEGVCVVVGGGWEGEPAKASQRAWDL